MTWTDAETTSTAWGTTNRGVRVITEINNELNYNQPELDYLGYYLTNETQYNEVGSVETAWREI